jgi:iron complex outermembrane recepter protein
MSKEHLRTSTIVAGLAAFGVLSVMPTLAMAQERTAAQQEEDARRQADQDAAELDDVVVVGSRIRRDTYNSPSPVQVVTREETVLAGYSSTTAVLQGTGVTGGSSQINNAYGGFVTDGGPGANTLSLRGLGPSRTLVLLNGRRVSPAGSRGSVGSADLNVLPTAMIERIEVLRDGASSIYGSDAVAGVVNIITRNNIDGITIEGQYNFPTEANGAGDQTRFSVVGGLQGDRFHISASAEYYTREEVTLADRDFTQCNTDYRLNRDTGAFSDFIDPLTGQRKCYPITGTGSNGVTINTIGTSNRTGDPRVTAAGGVVLLPGVVGAQGVPQIAYDNGVFFNRWRPNSAVTTGLVGFEGVGGSYLNNPDPNLATAFVPLNLNIRDTFEEKILKRSLVSPVEVTTFYAEAGYDLNALGNAELYAEMLVNNRQSSQTGYRQLSLDYNRGSLLIPANLQFSNFLAPQPTSQPGVNVGVRAFIGFGNDTSSQDNDFTKITTGIRGDFIVPGWRYDAYYSYARSDSSYTFESFITSALRDSLNVVIAPAGTPAWQTRSGILPTTGAQGTVTCAVNVTNPNAGCIPAPFLTTQTIGGQLPEDWKNYVFRPVTGDTFYDESTFSIGFDGPLFSLPAGKIQAFVGAEYRSAEIDDTPPLDSINGNLLNLTTAQPTRGTDSVYEVFGELEIPLLANMPLAQELTLNVSGRYTDYDSYGDDTTYKVGLLYTPFDWVSLRSTYGTSYRAPALFEQFLGATSGFLNQSSDPCNNYGAAGVNPNRAANCATEGLPQGGSYSATQGITVFSQGGAGTGALAAETSTNFTVGLILQPTLPTFFGDLSFAVDYYKIEVNNGVSRVGSGNILSRCYDSTTADFNADNGLCRLVSRDPAGSRGLTVRDAYTNVSTDIVEGIDYNARWTRELGVGRILANVSVTQYLQQASQLFADDPLDEVNGTIGAPEYTATADVSYAWDKFRVRYGVEWIAGQDSYEYVGLSGPSDYVFDTPDYYVHNLSVQYSADEFTVTAGVRNLLDEDLPSISQGAYNRIGNAPLYSGYDYVGRTGFISVTKSF